VRFVPEQDESVDMVLFLNGLPVATAELKNPLTGQNFEHAISQYQRRDPKHRLFHWSWLGGRRRDSQRRESGIGRVIA
jgi:type I restriction enzyme R subunit